MSEFAKDYKETVGHRLRQDPEFATALLDEAVSLFLNGEPATARLILRELVQKDLQFLLAQQGGADRFLHLFSVP